MATHRQKYNGKNNFNNIVDIDYEKKRVKFKPIKGGMTPTSNYMTTALIIQGLIRWVLTIYLFVILGLNVMLDSFDRIRMAKVMLLFVGIWYVSRYIALILLATIPILKENYPKINARVLNLYSILTKGKSRLRKGYVNLELIENNKLIIDDFDNIMLEYKMTGEVAEYIKRIYIQNKFKDNPHEWRLVITWKKRPTKGNLYLEYI